MRIITETEIQVLLKERKALPAGFKLKRRKKQKINHEEYEGLVRGTAHVFKKTLLSIDENTSNRKS
jgi:hypothetical protein